MARVLVACEESGRVRDAFIRRGHDATSCDLLPSRSDLGRHVQGDVLELLRSESFDLIIGHPPCQFMTLAGVRWLWNKVDGVTVGKNEERWTNLIDAAEFFRALLNADAPMIAIENPIMHGYAKSLVGVEHSQVIQPYEFGDDASKRTCLWLKGLPELEIDPSKYVAPRIVDGRKRWANQTDSGQNRLGPSADRAKLRSTTYQGIADAMAEQWGAFADAR